MNEILDQLRTTFSTTFGSTFTTYFKGKLKLPALDDMPILTVYPVSTVQKHSGTLRDDVIFTIGVEIFVSLKQYFDNTNGQGTQLDTLDALIDLVEQRESDGDAEDDTILGILADNLTVGTKVLYTDNYRIDYDEYIVGNSTIGRATVIFDAHDRPNRQN
jgi:hypothetical protein